MSTTKAGALCTCLFITARSQGFSPTYLLSFRIEKRLFQITKLSFSDKIFKLPSVLTVCLKKLVFEVIRDKLSYSSMCTIKEIVSFPKSLLVILA